jgi:hypothetical protein
MKILFALILTLALQHQAMPPGMTHEQHLKQMQKDAELKKRGALAMGFDQDKTTHRFPVSPAGGSIEVDAIDPDDHASRDQIRTHLREIAKSFARGDFAKPFQTHAEVPPGVPEMQRLKEKIRYQFNETPRGGAVRITTTDAAALAAVHAFLAYQTREHTHHGG